MVPHGCVPLLAGSGQTEQGLNSTGTSGVVQHDPGGETDATAAGPETTEH